MKRETLATASYYAHAPADFDPGPWPVPGPTGEPRPGASLCGITWTERIGPDGPMMDLDHWFGTGEWREVQP